MEIVVGLIVQLIAGAAGGNVIGQLAKQFSLGTTGNTVAGAIGGVAATWLAGYIPGLSGLVGGTAAAAADGAAAAGGLDLAVLVGQGLTGLVGGGLLTIIAGLVKSMTAKA